MEIYTERQGDEIVLVAVLEKRDSLCRAKDFAHVGEPLRAVICEEPRTKKLYIEIRKERS